MVTFLKSFTNTENPQFIIYKLFWLCSSNRDGGMTKLITLGQPIQRTDHTNNHQFRLSVLAACAEHHLSFNISAWQHDSVK